MENDPEADHAAVVLTPSGDLSAGPVDPAEEQPENPAALSAPDETPLVPIQDAHAKTAVKPLRTLVVDVGGTGIKAEVLNEAGKSLTSRARVPTPQPATPAAVVAEIQKLAKKQGKFNRVSVGFPGVVKEGVVFTAPNLGPRWKNFNLAQTLRQKLRRPVRISNDADVQGFGVITGRGVEMVITLGTGVGSALFVDGVLVPNLELGHHPFLKGKTYEEKLSHAALEKAGKKKWNKRLVKAVQELQLIFNYDKLYLGGGNSKHISVKLPPNTKVVSNEAGLWGGIALWRD
ncbi:MAG: ROK family protein [Acidobacteriia bacterium]|nr:ROK family protein [Terriglobia bacterium]